MGCVAGKEEGGGGGGGKGGEPIVDIFVPHKWQIFKYLNTFVLFGIQIFVCSIFMSVFYMNIFGYTFVLKNVTLWYMVGKIMLS